MTLEQYANLAQILGVIIVVVTLIFLSVQVQQSTRALRSAATQTSHQHFSELYEVFVKDEAFRQIYAKSFDDPSAVTPLERMKLNAWWMQGLINCQNWFFQTKEGAMDHVLLDSYSSLLRQLIATHSFQVFWKARKQAFASEFVEFIDALGDEKLSEDYSPLGVRVDAK